MAESVETQFLNDETAVLGFVMLCHGVWDPSHERQPEQRRTHHKVQPQKKRGRRMGVTKATVPGHNNKRHINGDATAGCD